MSVDFVSPHASPSDGGLARLVPLRHAHPALVDQQNFVSKCAKLMLRSGVSGHRLVTVLHLMLTQHEATPAVDEGGSVHLTCDECRPNGRAAGAQYPCPTAQQAFWALDAILS